MTIAYEDVPVQLADGEVVNLRRPTYGVAGLNYGPMHPETLLSPRVAPPMIGVGLLEAIPEADIVAGADPDDADGDGISGRPNRVWSDEHDTVMLGRFGWKAGAPTVAQQSAGAFIPYQFFLMLPYIMSIVAMIVMARRTRYPAALLVPFRRGERV